MRLNFSDWNHTDDVAIFALYLEKKGAFHAFCIRHKAFFAEKLSRTSECAETHSLGGIPTNSNEFRQKCFMEWTQRWQSQCCTRYKQHYDFSSFVLLKFDKIYFIDFDAYPYWCCFCFDRSHIFRKNAQCFPRNLWINLWIWFAGIFGPASTMEFHSTNKSTPANSKFPFSIHPSVSFSEKSRKKCEPCLFLWKSMKTIFATVKIINSNNFQFIRVYCNHNNVFEGDESARNSEIKFKNSALFRGHLHQTIYFETKIDPENQ